MKLLGIALILFVCACNLLIGCGYIDRTVPNTMALNELQFLFIYIALGVQSFKLKYGVSAIVSFSILSSLSILNLLYIFTNIPELIYFTGSIQGSIYGTAALLIIFAITKFYERNNND